MLYGFSMALMLRSGLGLNPWDVFHQGLFEQMALSFGTVVILVGVAVMLLWVPLRQRPGFGTRSEEHTSELQSLMRISYAVFCLKKKNINSHTSQALS